MEKILKIRPYARLLTMLGEQLIKNEQIALAELIKNSYDADADWVKVSFENFDYDENKNEIYTRADSKIIVEDNGSGMELIANVCQVVGAVACGFLFVVLFARGGSLIPCILAHSVKNMVSVFADEVGMTVTKTLILSGANLIIVIGYTFVLLKTLPKDALYEKV